MLPSNSIPKLIPFVGAEKASAVLILLITALLSWRFYRFTIQPFLFPNEPEELPYWIPYLGHARSFFKDFNAVLDNGRTYVKDTKAPYSIYIAGTRIYVVTAPSDVADLDRSTTTLSYHDTIKSMYKSVGATHDTIDKLFIFDPSASYNFDAHRPMLAVSMLTEYHRQQTSPGKRLTEILNNCIIPSMSRTLEFNELREQPYTLGSTANDIKMSLLDLCNQLFVHSTLEAFLGRSIWKVNPNILASFRTWEHTNWKFMYQIPTCLASDMITARDDIINTFVKYLQMSSADKQDNSFFAQTAERMLREMKCSEEDIAKIFFLHFWAILGNVYKVAFWTVAYLAYNPKLLQSIRTEIAPFTQNGKLEEEHLVEDSPKLQSLISEVLRLSITTGLVRDIVKPTLVQGKVLRAGNKLMIPFRQLHLNRDVWGQDPYAIDPERFEKDPKLLHSKSYRPFGGGPTLCPGRFLARRSVGIAVALLISRFDISVDTEHRNNEKKRGSTNTVPRFPRMDTTKPSPGASLPCEGDDVILLLKRYCEDYSREQVR